MLVEFSVENYRSFQEKQTLSMVAADNETMQETNTFPMPNTNDLRLLKSAAIYGPNASGKSNLIKAINTLKEIVVNSASRMQVGDKLPVKPFKLNTEFINKSSTFEIIFIQQGIRYEYGVSLNRERIFEEWLIAYPNEIQQNWFSREYIPENPDLQVDDGYKWSFGRGLKGEKNRIKKFVRPNSLFLSHAAQNNHPQLTEIFNFFQKLNIVNSNITVVDFTLPLLEDDNFLAKITKLLHESDIGISSLIIQASPVSSNLLDSDFPKFIKHELEKRGIKDVKEIIDVAVETLDIITVHKMNDSDQEVEFNLADESDGTQRLFEIAGYWLYILEHGEILIVDELERSLHPELSKALVKMFNDPEVNKNNAQLIFATHDTTLLDEEILRPDQIWLTDKQNSMTKLYSLLDFRVREDESLQKGYLLGRYGAIPYIKKLTI